MTDIIVRDGSVKFVSGNKHHDLITISDLWEVLPQVNKEYRITYGDLLRNEFYSIIGSGGCFETVRLDFLKEKQYRQ